MATSEQTIAIIPARGGSKGLPRKNIRQLAGKPLIAYSIESSLGASLVDRTIISTDDDEIADIAWGLGAEVVMRPPELATDTIPTEPCMIHVVEELERSGCVIDLVVLLQPTTPLRPPTLIDDCITKLRTSKSDSLLTVRESRYFFWERTAAGVKPSYDPVHRPRRQDMRPKYVENGNVYVTKHDLLMKQKTRLGGKIEMVEMMAIDSLDIDSDMDFWLAEQAIIYREGHS